MNGADHRQLGKLDEDGQKSATLVKVSKSWNFSGMHSKSVRQTLPACGVCKRCVNFALRQARLLIFPSLFPHTQNEPEGARLTSRTRESQIIVRESAKNKVLQHESESGNIA
jgi:hypothetical protein